MAALHVSDEIASQIEALAHRTGQSKDDLVREAILTYIEDREDALLAAKRLGSPGERVSLEAIGRKYGLAD